MVSERTQFHFDPPHRILLGPGPSEVPARVLAAMARPTVGYLDETYTAVLEELQRLLRMVFRTENDATFAVTGSGTAAMEAAITNVTEPGDRVLVCVHGFFGDRMRQIFERTDAEVHVVATDWGKPTAVSAVQEALAGLGKVAVVAVVHGETSTGVRQDIPELAELARSHGALCIVDAVASLGGVAFETDAWGVDVAYTGAQKCLSAPPGMSPITFGPRAMERIEARKSPCRSWYLDAKLNLTYWDRPHKYHHTGSINLGYALLEALRMLEEEGLSRRIHNTARIATGLWAGLEALGLSLPVAAEHRLTTLTTVGLPDGIDEAKVRAYLMKRHGIEIAGGLGAFAGKAWRIGLMGASARERNVTLLLAALEAALRAQGHTCVPGAAVAAATDRFDAT